MAATGYTPSILFNSVTTGNTPSSLVQGETAWNITDKKLWVGNASGTPIQLIGAGASGSFGALSCTSLTDSGLTSGRVTYAGTAGLLQDSASLTFNGSVLALSSNPAQITIRSDVAPFSWGGFTAPNNVEYGQLTWAAGTAIAVASGGNDFSFNVGSAERLRITASGNVGIGTSSPEASLQNNGANGRFILSAGNAPSSGATTNKWRMSLRETAEGDLSLQHYNGTSYDTPFYINSSGNVGIGTSSPSGAKLHVYSASASVNIKSECGAGNQAGVIAKNSRDYIQIAVDSTTVYVDGGVSSPMAFFTGNAERMRLDTSGNLLVGTTGANGKIVASGFANSVCGRFEGNPTGSLTLIQCVSTATSGTNRAIAFLQNNGEAGTITITNTSASYNTSSDYRLKEITGNLTGYKERIMSLQPKQGTWKADGSIFKGFLAHEFATQYPSAVNGEKDAVDAEGKPQYQGMQAGGSETIADLVALVQEQQALITTMQAKLKDAGILGF